MKMRYLFDAVMSAAMALVLASCGDANRTMLPNVSGKAGEVIVVMDKNGWDGNLGNEVRELLAADYPFLPQKEPTFSLVNIAPNGFADLFKVHRNLIFFHVGVAPADTGMVYRTDVWAHPQCVIQLSAVDEDNAIRLLRANGERIVNTFEQAERDRIMANSKKYEALGIAPAVRELTGGSPCFPNGYKLLKQTDDFIWIADVKQYTNQGVFVYRYPASDKENFTEESIVSHRNEFLKKYVPGMFDNTYMTTSEYETPQVTFIRFRGRQFAETRGYWEVQNDFMGGPFVSHSFYSRDGRDIIVLDGFVYAPKYDKRQYLREVESILYSFEWTKMQEEEPEK